MEPIARIQEETQEAEEDVTSGIFPPTGCWKSGLIVVMMVLTTVSNGISLLAIRSAVGGCRLWHLGDDGRQQRELLRRRRLAQQRQREISTTARLALTAASASPSPPSPLMPSPVKAPSSSPRMYFFLTHLAVADALTVLLTLLPELLWTLASPNFAPGDDLCRVSKFLQMLAPYLR